MARSRTEDLLQTFSFWLFDVVPSIKPPFLAFNPRMGFSAITMPEITFETSTIRDGTSPWIRKVTGKATVGQVTLSRGATYWDDDFWRWVETALLGQGAPRKTLCLMHLTNVSPQTANFGVGELAAGGAFAFAPHDVLSCTGRMWVMSGCLPSRYKPGSDFDAMSSAVSIQELGIEVESLHQVNMDTENYGIVLPSVIG